MKKFITYLKISCVVFGMIVFMSIAANATNYYSRIGATNANSLSSWTNSPSGSGGGNPGSFGGTSDLFIVRVGDAFVTTGIWSVAGSLQVLGTLSTGNTNTWTMSIAKTTSVTGTLTLNNSSQKSFTGDVTVNSGGNFVIPSTAVTVLIFGNLSVSVGGILKDNHSYDPTTVVGKNTYLRVDGNVSILGTYSYGAFLPALWMDGAGAPTITTGTTSLCRFFVRKGDVVAVGTVSVDQDFYALWDTTGVSPGSFKTGVNTVNALWGIVVSGGTFTVNGGTLNVFNGGSNGGLRIGGTFSAAPPGVVNISSGTINAAIITVGDSTGDNLGTINQSGGTVNITGSLYITKGTTQTSSYIVTGTTTPIVIGGNFYNAATYTNSASANTISVSGNWMNNGTITPGTNTVTFNGSTAELINGSATTPFNNLIINNTTSANTVTSQTKAFTVANDLTVTKGNLIVQANDANYTVAGNFIVSTNGTFTHSVSWDTYGKQLTVGGNVDVTGLFTYTTRSHLQMTGTSKTIRTGTPPSSALSILTLSGATVNANGTVTVNDNFWAMFSTSGSFSTNGQTVTAKASLLNSGGTVNVNGGSLTVTGGISVGGTTTNNGTFNISSGTVVTDGLTLGDATGTLANTITQTGGTLTVNGAVTINQPNANSITNQWNINAATPTVTGTISFFGTNTTTTRVAEILITTGTLNANAGISFALAGITTATKVIDMSTGGGTGTINLKGALTNASGATLTAGLSGSVFNYADDVFAQTVNIFGSGAYNNLHINTTGGIGATLNGAITASNCTGNLRVQSGTLNNGGFAIAGNAGKIVQVADAAFLNLSGVSSAFPTAFGTVTLGTASTVIYSGSGNQTIDAQNYGHLTLQGALNKTAPSGTLTIYGNLSKTTSSVFVHNNGLVLFTGSVAQNYTCTTSPTMDFYSFTNNNIVGLNINNDMSITKELLFGASSKLTLAGNITLKSGPSNTANVAIVPLSSSITYGAGLFIVERYIPATRKWRLLAVPTNSTQTIKAAWQEGATTSGSNPNAGYGTQISNNVVGTYPMNGFDFYSPNGPSMKVYDPATNSYTGIANTTGTINNSSGYMTFIRGDRTVAGLGTATSTRLRTKGPLKIGSQSAVSVGAGQLAVVGNPYASAVEFGQMTMSNLNNSFYVWDPSLTPGAYGLGAFQTIKWIGGITYTITPGGGSYTTNHAIESGAAFFVKSSGLAGSVTFTESAKISGSNMTARANNVTSTLQQFRLNLFTLTSDTTKELTDGNIELYDASYADNIDSEDAEKLVNMSENFGILSGAKTLAIEARSAIQAGDTIFYSMTGMRKPNYQLEFTSDNVTAGLNAFLEDSYSNSRTQVNLDGTATTYNFSITSAPGTWAANRFHVVFLPVNVLPVTFVSVKATKQEANINVEWKVENESNMKQYEVERSANGQAYTKIATLAAKGNNGSTAAYLSADTDPFTGNNYYRIKSIDINGKTSYSNIVKVVTGREAPGISVYPNPIVNGIINLQLVNQPKGMYGVKLVDDLGRVMFSRQIDHAEGSNTEQIKINANWAKGSYQLQVTKPDNNKVNTKILN